MKEKVKILYVYGYGSSPDSRTSQWLQRNLPDVEVTSCFYSQTCPEDGLRSLIQYVKMYGINLVIGSSLGGWFAMNVCASLSLPCILINPLTEETLFPTLKKVSDSWWPVLNENYKEYTDYHPLFTPKCFGDGSWKLEKWDSVENGWIAWVIWSDQDELVITDKIPSSLKKNIKNITHIPDGKHRLTDEQLKEHLLPAYHKIVSEIIPKYDDFYSKTYINP